jgi:ribose transport system ATP-binding protein
VVRRLVAEMACLVLDRLGKSYGPTRALSDLSLTVRQGEVVALVGENGAGKSTLAKLLAGVEAPDTGAIMLDGRACRLTSPRDAMLHGVGFIPQELAPVPTLSLAENLFLGDWPTRRGIVRRNRMEAAARAELAAFGFAELDVTRRASIASLAELQVIEIVKAVRRRCSVIVFDEPTASLSEAEARTLHQIIATLSARGVAVIYISHRMDEVFAFSQRICVLRNGRKVGEHETAQARRETIIEEIVGRHVPTGERVSRVSAGAAELLKLETCWRHEQPALGGVSLVLHSGEILALYGLRGSGAEAVAAVLGGHLRAAGGRLRVRGREVPLPRGSRDAKRLGIRYIPADRKTQGLALRLPVADNICLPNLRLVSRFGVVTPRRQRRAVAPLIERLRIRLRTPKQLVQELSGGNQQKVLLASRLTQQEQGHILVLQEPTRGVDVGARADIHEVLRELAAQGTAVLLFSSDVDEVVSVADRVLVVRDGRVVAELAGSGKTQANAVTAATAPHLGGLSAAAGTAGPREEKSTQ